MYKFSTDIIKICEQKNCKISDVVIDTEMQNSELSEIQIKQKLKSLFDIMEKSCKKTLNKAIPSVSGLTGGDAKKLYEYTNNKKTISGKDILTGVYYGLSCFEVNTSMGKIVAAPTAGSCGIVPATLLAYKEKFNIENENLILGLATASGVGNIIATNATVSGAEGGCQAECGAAAAMAAAACVEMSGGTPKQSFDAAAITLKNVMGLVCDPVAGLVEIPCAKRNAIGVANAMLSADLVLAGIISNIPFDEVVDAMYKVGRALPESLRETAKGGVANTKTGLCMCKKVFGE